MSVISIVLLKTIGSNNKRKTFFNYTYFLFLAFLLLKNVVLQSCEFKFYFIDFLSFTE